MAFTEVQMKEALEEREEEYKAKEAATAAATRTAEIAQVSLKIPPFWPNRAKLWFTHAEAQFVIKQITCSKTKFAHTLTMLDTKTADLVMDLLTTPPTVEPYETLKARLIEIFDVSDSEKAARLLDIGDKTPSKCLSAMLLLLPNPDPGILFRELFLRQLPQETRSLVAQTPITGSKVADLRALAKEADKYFLSVESRISSVAWVPGSSAAFHDNQEVLTSTLWPTARDCVSSTTNLVTRHASASSHAH